MDQQAILKVFISWSGLFARDVARALRDWIPLLFDNVRPWMSETDIEAGQRGLAEIGQQLADTDYGLIVLTKSNVNSAWVNFEAGALSKGVGRSLDARVTPILVDLDGPQEVLGPLSQFQMRTLDVEGVESTMISIGRIINVPENVVRQRVKQHWTTLQTELHVSRGREGRRTTMHAPEAPNITELLSKILGHVERTAAKAEKPEALRVGRFAVERPLLVFSSRMPIQDLDGNGRVRTTVREVLEFGRSFGVELRTVRIDDGSDSGTVIGVAVDGSVGHEALEKFVNQLERTSSIRFVVV